MSKFERHFFICTTSSPPTVKPSCGARQSGDLYTAFQEALGAHPELWNTVAVTGSGCLGPCFDGPTIVVYPEGVWYGNLKLDDVREIIDSHLVGGKPVERLRYTWPTP